MVLFCFSVPPCPCAPVAPQASARSSAPSASSPSRRSARSICTKRYIRVSSPHILFQQYPLGTSRRRLDHSHISFSVMLRSYFSVASLTRCFTLPLISGFHLVASWTNISICTHANARFTYFCTYHLSPACLNVIPADHPPAHFASGDLLIPFCIPSFLHEY